MKSTEINANKSGCSSLISTFPNYLVVSLIISCNILKIYFAKESVLAF